MSGTGPEELGPATKFETFMSNAYKTVKIKISSVGAGCPN